MTLFLLKLLFNIFIFYIDNRNVLNSYQIIFGIYVYVGRAIC
jgi:hypothetical protein